MIIFHLKWWMNANRFVHLPGPKTFPYSDASQYGWELIYNWNDESFLSWSLVRRPVPAPYQHEINLLDSPELLQILVTLTAVIKPLLPKFLGKAIVILNFVRRFRTFNVDLFIDPNGVRKLLDRLNPHKSSGPDDLSARVLKECSAQIVPVLACIFNQSLAQGRVPEVWLQASVAPIYKK